MKLGGINLAPVIDDVARRHIIETDADVAETHAACRSWWEAFKPTVELWAGQPVHDLRGMVYRYLTNHLRGYPAHMSADHKGLLWVIAAGARDELPARLQYEADESDEITWSDFSEHDHFTICAWSRWKLHRDGSEHG